MKDQLVSKNKFWALKFLALLFFSSIVYTTSSYAQNQRLPDGRPAEDVDSPPGQHQVFLGRIREGEEVPKKSENKQKVILEQIRKDFIRLQVIELNILSPAISSEKIDRKQFAKTISEIKTLAVRLKDNLHLPDSEKEKSPGENMPATQKERLKMLDSLIKSFVSNSIFQNKNSIDIPSAIKADQDLRLLIKLCEVSKKLI